MHSLQTLLILVGLASLGLILAGWVVYPVALRLLRPRRDPEPAGSPAETELPSVDIIIATRETAPAVVARVRDLLEADYPSDRLRIFVGVDAAGAVAASEIRQALQGIPSVEVAAGDLPGGKAAALNAAVRAGQAPMLVFTDTAQRFDRSTISRLIRCVVASGAGGASGYLRARGDRGALGRFWSYETTLRGLESEFDSLVGVTGAVYALRREAWTDLRPGLINDDLAVPLLARKAGFRVLHCPSAEAFDDRAFPRIRQFDRRVRTLTGVYQLLAWYPWLLAPAANPLWAQFLLHKAVRLATPFLLMFVGLALLAAGWAAVLFLSAFVLVGGVFVLAMLSGRSPGAAVAEIGWALALLLLAPAVAARNAIRGEWEVWARPSPAAGNSGA